MIQRVKHPATYLSELTHNKFTVLEEDFAHLSTDQEKFEAALLQGGDIILTQESYTLTSLLEFSKSGTRLVGLPSNGVTITFSGASGFIRSATASSAQLKSCGLIGRITINASANTGTLIDMTGVSYPSILDVTLVGNPLSAGKGILLGGFVGTTAGSYGEVQRCTFQGLQYGIQIEDTAIGSIVSCNHITVPANGYGVHIGGTADALSWGCSVHQNTVIGAGANTTGVLLGDHCDASAVRNNYFSNLTFGWRIHSATATANLMGPNKFSGCTTDHTDSGTSTINDD